MCHASVAEYFNATGIYNRGSMNGIVRPLLRSLGLPDKSIDVIPRFEEHTENFEMTMATYCYLFNVCENTARTWFKPLRALGIMHTIRRGDGVLVYIIRYPQWILEKIAARVAELKRRKTRKAREKDRSKIEQQTAKIEVDTSYKNYINNKQADDSRSVDNPRGEAPTKEAARSGDTRQKQDHSDCYSTTEEIKQVPNGGKTPAGVETGGNQSANAGRIPDSTPNRKNPPAPDTDSAMLCRHPGCNHRLTIAEFAQCQLESMRYGIRCSEHFAEAINTTAHAPHTMRNKTGGQSDAGSGWVKSGMRKINGILPTMWRTVDRR